MDAKLQVLLHALGLDAYGEGRQYRNHFVTGEGSVDFPVCTALVADGLMTEQTGSALSGGDPVFVATPAGIEYVSTHSPKRPPRPDLTPSQRRYRAFLRADCGLSFGEWLGGGRRHGLSR